MGEGTTPVSEVEQVLGLGDVREGWRALVINGALYFQDEKGSQVGPFCRGDGALVRAPSSSVPELWPDEHQDVMDAAWLALLQGAASVEDVNGIRPEVPVGAQYALPSPAEVNGLPVWRLEVISGLAMLRQPDGTRVGPFKWNERKSISDRASYLVTDEWMTQFGEDVLPALDELILTGAVREFFEGYIPPQREETPPSPSGTGEGTPTSRENGGGGPDVSAVEARAVAEKLSGYAPKVLLVLKGKNPQSTATIGVQVQSARPTVVINKLEAEGLVSGTPAEGYSLTMKGAAVASALEDLTSQKGKRK
jgi:hypothetical protein